jgi:hypothetical protein
MLYENDRDRPFALYTYRFTSDNIVGLTIEDLYEIYEYNNCIIFDLPNADPTPIIIYPHTRKFFRFFTYLGKDYYTFEKHLVEDIYSDIDHMYLTPKY